MAKAKKTQGRKTSTPSSTVRLKTAVKMEPNTLWNLPNILTMGRVVVIPVVLLLMASKGYFEAWIAGWLFVAAGVTDFFDGYLARRWKVVSPFGRFLDPIADKVLVSSVILMLAHNGQFTHYAIFPAMIILIREILVSGLREFLAELRVLMPVSRLAKWKTACQLVAMPMMIVGDVGEYYHFNLIGPFFFWTAAILTLMTGFDYMRAGWKYMR